MASFPIARQNIFIENWSWHLLATGERLAAFVLLAVASPVILVGACVIRILSGRTPFIAQRRVGWRGSSLWMIKLRTMWTPGSPKSPRPGWIEFIGDESGPARKHPSDARIPHAFARFCRRHSIDELPQLWHVVRGEMTLVGPRPVTRRELREYYGPEAAEVLQLKPGIAGLWQTSGRGRLSYPERVSLDLQYVRNRSFQMYVRILLRTFRQIWSGADTW